MSERDIYLSVEPIDGISAGHYMDLNIALFRLMQDKELSRITVTEVAEEAGVSRKTFYNYFHNVEGLARYIIEGNAETYARNFTECLIQYGNLDRFFEFKKASIEYYYRWYQTLALTADTNVIYEKIFHEWVDRALARLKAAGAILTTQQCYALKAVTYNIMALFSDWEITDKKERGISIDELIEFFKWASGPLVGCIVENRDEWTAVKELASKNG